jgi:hypothetical protein
MWFQSLLVTADPFSRHGIASSAIEGHGQNEPKIKSGHREQLLDSPSAACALE